MIDTHAHLFMCKASTEELIASAKNQGLLAIVNVALNLKTALTCLNLFKEDPFCLPTIGIYPGEPCSEDDFYQMEHYLDSYPDWVAIGEIGLDYFHMKADIGYQKRVFSRQLDLARRYKKPVIIHNRGADEDIIDIVSHYQDVKKVFHCFCSGESFISRVEHDSVYFSFTGMLTYSKKHPAVLSAISLPLDKVMVETDSPYLTPSRYKGKPNQPAYLKEIIARLAIIKGISEIKVAESVQKTAIKFFNIFSV